MQGASRLGSRRSEPQQRGLRSEAKHLGPNCRSSGLAGSISRELYAAGCGIMRAIPEHHSAWSCSRSARAGDGRATAEPVATAKGGNAGLSSQPVWSAYGAAVERVGHPPTRVRASRAARRPLAKGVLR